MLVGHINGLSLASVVFGLSHPIDIFYLFLIKTLFYSCYSIIRALSSLAPGGVDIVKLGVEDIALNDLVQFTSE